MRKTKLVYGLWRDKGNLFNIEDKLTLLRFFLWLFSFMV